jgi:alkylation response protein AidB-like acyl-CoA dehydrogenase
VRAFLAEKLAGRTPRERAQSWNGHDAAFSREVGQRGWIGMGWPKRYGGHERSALERYVVIEEMLAAGAPVAAHWTADRQSGPLLFKFGTEEQRQTFLPRIARGECFFCIGMSEPLLPHVRGEAARRHESTPCRPREPGYQDKPGDRDVGRSPFQRGLVRRGLRARRPADRA